MSKHTPGPWWLDHGNDIDLPNHVGISAERHGLLAQVVWRMEDDETTPRCEANARLIAAAPDLLAQLEIARDRIKDMLKSDDGQAFKEAAKWLPGIEQAIAKAEGQA